eukprot:272237-Pleurochrysis_carterae.AAC.2
MRPQHTMREQVGDAPGTETRAAWPPTGAFQPQARLLYMWRDCSMYGEGTCSYECLRTHVACMLAHGYVEREGEGEGEEQPGTEREEDEEGERETQERPAEPEKDKNKEEHAKR